MIPDLSDVIVHKSYRLGAYSAVLLTDIPSPGPIQFLFVLAVIKDGEASPCYYVTSEINLLQGELLRMAAEHFPESSAGSTPNRERAPFLCVFEQGGLHTAMSSSFDWKDPDKFSAKALELAAKYVGFTGEPIETTNQVRRMNVRRFSLTQRWVLAVIAAVLFLMILFPPVNEHIVTGTRSNIFTLSGHAGYRFLFGIGEYNSRRSTESINLGLLLIQCLVVGGIGGCALFLLKERR